MDWQQIERINCPKQGAQPQKCFLRVASFFLLIESFFIFQLNASLCLGFQVLQIIRKACDHVIGKCLVLDPLTNKHLTTVSALKRSLPEVIHGTQDTHVQPRGDLLSAVWQHGFLCRRVLTDPPKSTTIFVKLLIYLCFQHPYRVVYSLWNTK